MIEDHDDDTLKAVSVEGIKRGLGVALRVARRWVRANPDADVDEVVEAFDAIERELLAALREGRNLD